MRQIITLWGKEFRQVFRDPMMMRIIFIIPIIQLMVLAYAATFDLRHVEVAVLDQDHSPASRELLDTIFHSSDQIFLPGLMAETPAQLRDALSHGRADLTLWIPRGFSEDITANTPAQLGIQVDGRNSSMAGRAAGYLAGVIRLYSEAILAERRASAPVTTQTAVAQVTAVNRVYYNPELVSQLFMVPGIIVLLVTIISGLLTGMAVVREKEIGTLEQLMVTPITPLQLIIGKTVPFAVLSFFELTLATAIALLWFKIPLVGSPWLLAGTSMLYLIVTLGVGLLASTVSRTQQQAMFAVWFFLVFGILMSGFFFPIDNMPGGVQKLTLLNPMRYFMTCIRGIFLKGATVSDLAPQIAALAGLGVVVFGTAVLRFSKRLK